MAIAMGVCCLTVTNHLASCVRTAAAWQATPGSDKIDSWQCGTNGWCSHVVCLFKTHSLHQLTPHHHTFICCLARCVGYVSLWICASDLAYPTTPAGLIWVVPGSWQDACPVRDPDVQEAKVGSMLTLLL
ncbi:hypothetical protein V8C86DRAFT_51486 [Haematococcus lacustris]